MRAWRTYKYNEDVPAAIGALKLETNVPIPTPKFISIANFSPTDPGNSDYEFVNGIVKSSGKDLKALVDLAEAGKLKCCVDEHFPFDKVPEALSKSLTARSGGKLIIDVA